MLDISSKLKDRLAQYQALFGERILFHQLPRHLTSGELIAAIELSLDRKEDWVSYLFDLEEVRCKRVV